MKLRTFLIAMLPLVLSGCVKHSKEYNFQMDYPVDAARLSLGGDVNVQINCATRKMDVISDTSDGLFSRHIYRRLSNICYKKTDSMNVIYHFIADKGVKQNMIATQYPRVPPKSDPNELSKRDSDPLIL